MDQKKLVWSEENKKQILDCKIFTLWESFCKPPESRINQNKLQAFTVIDAKDWAIVVPVVEGEQGKQFVMVWQWRHGAQDLSLEFPGGVFEEGEDPKEAALRELREETGYVPRRIEKIGEFNPNPAIMSNKVHFFLAQELENCGRQNLDEDEFVEVVLIDTGEVMQNMGKKPYIHALMGTALSLYNQRK